jgi:hypothetical protein
VVARLYERAASIGLGRDELAAIHAAHRDDR